MSARPVRFAARQSDYYLRKGEKPFWFWVVAYDTLEDLKRGTRGIPLIDEDLAEGDVLHGVYWAVQDGTEGTWQGTMRFALDSDAGTIAHEASHMGMHVLRVREQMRNTEYSPLHREIDEEELATTIGDLVMVINDRLVQRLQP